MAKVQFSDVTPPERRSIRDIPIPNSGKRKVPIIIKPEKGPASKTEPAFETEEKTSSSAYEYYYPKNNKESLEQYHREGDKSLPTIGQSRRKRWVFGTIISVLIAVFIVGMMTVFASATINIVPKSQEVEVDSKIVASNEAEGGAIRYEVIKLSKSNTVSVPTAGEEAVELKASGKIVIYNNFSSEPQRLIVRTRFESPEGLIYRIPESMVVPGKSVKNGVGTPGSIEVEVFADEAGEKYNIKKSDFTIPGFKNDASRYKNFYARSLTDMAGGFVGKMKTVSPSDKDAALQKINSETEVELVRDLQSKVPEGLVLLGNSVLYKSKELPQKEDASSVVIGKEVTAYAVMLDRQQLSDKIISEYISKLPDWTDIKSKIKGFSALNAVGVPDNLETAEKIDLQIKGKVKVLADINIDTIGQRLLGAPKREAAKLIDEFAGILSVTATVRPIWKQSFPDDPLKIYVQTSD